ncbi:dihydrodipicolinate synthase family protein [Amycolatopsis thermophila]|uniref:4-hydroxy-tetrahydrodipicolinate synthase n=1 Tax=Amycolatopsis thermophila TaxID=206084 RepID=A0ABU0F5K4_9PSEU|nr:dihydrodipicolinate synthase family protein [Amycolatopsis thermophila]MDQ0382863.1 4-hydroxy-tetrahydrodipicolinate synthase [Amycolatopsis thermophila]
MPPYTRAEARDWAREKLVGAINCTIPSFTADLRGINEKAIRHDVALAKQHGFLGTLGVSEVSITLPEYLDFLRIARDEAGSEFVLVHHGSWSNLEQNLEAVRGAEDAGADLVLLSYPPNFYPESEQDIYDYTKAVCDATNLAVILFPMYLWGFSPRIHPSDIPARLIRRLIDDCPNIAVIKAEGGFPSIQSVIECHRLFGDEVVISMPIEGELIPLSQVMPIQLSATSDHEYYGPTIPRVMELLRGGKYDEAAEIYWQLHPARKIKSGLAGALHGGAFLNRQAWKFQGWLQGYNGGPLRQPTQRIHDAQMTALRKGLVDAGLDPSMDPFREFFIGRNPA